MTSLHLGYYLSDTCFYDRQTLIEGRVASPTVLLVTVRVDPQEPVASAKVHEQVVVALSLVVSCTILVLVLIDLNGDDNVTDDGPQINASLGGTAATIKVHVDRFIPRPGQLGSHGRLQDGVDPLDLLRLAPDVGCARVVRKQVSEAVRAVVIIPRIA